MKKIIISILILMCFVGIASATTVTLDPLGVLANASYKATQSVVPNFIVEGNSSTYNCRLWTNENGSSGPGTWREVQTDSSVSNFTNISLSTRNGILESVGTEYDWDVFCNASSDYSGDWGDQGNQTEYLGGYEYAVDVTNPSITAFPASSFWDTDGKINITLLVEDENAGVCVPTSTINTTNNGTNAGTLFTYGGQSYVNMTSFNFTNFDGTGTVQMADNNSGAYTWNATCNDTAGNIASVSVRTILVDTVNPSAFAFNTTNTVFRTNNVVLVNDSTATDYTPQIGWNQSIDVNFDYYEIDFCNSTDDCVSLNITSTSTLITNMSTLDADTKYDITITAYDEAGNSKTMNDGEDYYYTTDSTNRALKSGWNIIGNPGNAFSLSEILNWTGATTASYYNNSHLFESHTDGGSYTTTNVKGGDIVFLYFSADTTVSDLVRNTTSLGALNYNLTNTTEGNWNIVMNQNWTDEFYLSELDRNFNGNGTELLYLNITSFSSYDNSASTGSKYTSYICNWTDYSPNNATIVKYGEPVWMYVSDTVNVDTKVNIDWSAII